MVKTINKINKYETVVNPSQKREFTYGATMEDTYKQLIQYETVQRWFRQLKKRAATQNVNRKVPAATKRMMIESLRDYLSFLSKKEGKLVTPDDIIKDLQHQLMLTGSFRKHNDLLDEFWESFSSSTTAKLRFAAVKSFYSRNDYKLTVSSPGVPTVREGKFNLTSDMIRAICDVAPINHSSWILANNYLAVRIGVIPELTVSNFLTHNWSKDQPLYPVFIPKRLTGYFDITSYIGYDAMMLLKHYFKINDFKESDRPWKFATTNYMNQQFKKYAYKAGVIDAPYGLWPNGSPKGLCPLHSHVFRSRKQTIMGNHKISEKHKDYALGHISRGVGARYYEAPSTEDIYNTHLQILPDLEIYGHHHQSPTQPNVEVHKILALEHLRKSGFSQEKLTLLENQMKMLRVQPEVDKIFKNVLQSKPVWMRATRSKKR